MMTYATQLTMGAADLSYWNTWHAKSVPLGCREMNPKSLEIDLSKVQGTTNQARRVLSRKDSDANKGKK
jgi:hypothetical protein